MKTRKRKARTRSRPAKASSRAVAAPDSFPVVGIGASAGGLEAFERLLKRLPKDTGMAFVLVQHLDPKHESRLTEILSHATAMPVAQATNRMKVLPNHIYIIPPNRMMLIKGGTLLLEPRRERGAEHLPVDFFFRSLAADLKNRAIGVILSGTASDGAAGMKAIKAEGGITFAQDEKSAKYYGMPRSAVIAGAVDFVFTPGEIASYLAKIANHPYVVSLPPEEETQPESAVFSPTPEGAVSELRLLLKKSFGVDFAAYKNAMFGRRIKRRLALQGEDDLQRYLDYVKRNPDELRALFQDLFIGVTEFFRSPDMFQALKRVVFPALWKRHDSDTPVRIWVPGCSTGEEVYSLAICLLEFLGNRKVTPPIQIFGTDVNDQAIKRARIGRYGREIANNVGRERLRRHFVKVDGDFQVSKRVRELCVFAKHDILRDPPFSHLDLLSCRNLLIYFNPDTHRKLIPLFHYSLKPSGFLVLGSGETIGGYSDLFTLKSRKSKIYRRNETTSRTYFEFSAQQFPPLPTSQVELQFPVQVDQFERMKEMADQLILNQYGPPAVLVGENMEILHFRGHTGRFLEPAPGSPNLNLLKMTREGLLVGLQAAIQSARKKDVPVVRKDLRVDSDGQERIVNVRVVPLRAAGPRGRNYLVLFEDVSSQAGTAEKKRSSETKASLRSREDDRVSQLKREIAETKAYLQSVIENQEAGNEELRSLNEEVNATNEELQSSSEELETANEELQSANEELNTLNEELHHRNEELTLVSDDLLNVLNGLDLTVLMLDAEMRIRRLTPMAQKTLNLIAADVGRPLRDIRLPIEFPELERMVRSVTESGQPKDAEIQDPAGHWYSLQVLPYVTTEGKRDGTILALFNIHELKIYGAELAQLNERLQVELSRRREAEETARGAELRFNVVANSLIEAILHVDSELRIQFANHSAQEWFGQPHEGLTGRMLAEVKGDDAWRLLQPHAAKALGGEDSTFEGYLTFPGERRRFVRIDYIPERNAEGSVVGFFSLTNDLTALKQAEERFQTIVETAPNAIVISDRKGKIVLANRHAAILFGYRQEEMAGQTVDSLFASRLRKARGEDWVRYLRKFGSPGPEKPVELSGLRKNGDEFPAELSLSLLQSDGGVQNCCIIRDISLRQAAARDAQRSAVAEERNRLARDVHDTLAQGLAGVVLQLDQAKGACSLRPEEALHHIERALDFARSTLDQARHSVLSLTESPVVMKDLAGSLQDLLVELRHETESELELSTVGTPRRLDALIEENIMRIAQQALTNALQHSTATKIKIELRFGSREFLLRVADNGSGFKPAEVRRGFGLRSMRERAKLVGGKFQVESGPGKGTVVEVRVPLSRTRRGTT